MVKSIIKVLLCFSVLFVILEFAGESNQASASPHCQHSQPTLIETEGITIQCGTLAWAGIIKSARHTGSTNYVNNYVKTGGSSTAKSDFNKMPGTAKDQGGGVLTKTSDGKTVTYYPSSRSGEKPSLQYPASSGYQKWDKVRYE